MKYIKKTRVDLIRKKIIQKMDDGSITVEAAFVMPIVIITIFALIYLAFYLHDICRIKSIADLAVYKAGITARHEADLATGEVEYDQISERGVFYLLLEDTEEEEEQLRSYLSQQLSEGLFLVGIQGISINMDKFNISISIKTTTQVTLPALRHLFKPYSSTVVNSEFSVHNPAETIRCMEVVLETGSSIKGVDELKEKLESILSAGN